MTEEIKNIIFEILEKGYLMSLGTTDDGGIWVSDVIYIHDDNLNIYWMSHPSVRHSKAILDNNIAAGSITISGAHEDNLGLQFSGVAEKVDGDRRELLDKYIIKKGGKSISLDERSWYMLKIQNVDIICEKLWGFSKKNLKF